MQRLPYRPLMRITLAHDCIGFTLSLELIYDLKAFL